MVVAAARNWRCTSAPSSIRRRQTGSRPLVVADQRVGGRRRRQQTLGRADHDDDIDVETDGAGQRADVDAVAELAVAPRRDVELGDERRAELGAGDRPADAVEVLEAVEHPRRLRPRLGPRRRRGGRAGRDRTSARARWSPSPPLGPGTHARRGRRARPAQLADERSSSPAASASASRPPSRPPAARVVGEAGRAPAPSRPPARRRRRDRRAPTAPSGTAAPSNTRRHVGEQRHQLGAAQPPAVELEQLGEHARRHPLADGGARPTVPRHAGRSRAGARRVGRTGDRSGTGWRCGRTGCRRAPRRRRLARRCAPRRRRRWSTRRRARPPTRVGRRRPSGGRHRTVGERLGHGEDVGVGCRVAGEADHRRRPARARRWRSAAASSSGRSRWGRWTTTRDERAGRSLWARAIAAVSRSPSSYQSVRSAPHHLGGDARRLAAALGAGERRDSDPAPATRSSRYRSRRATMVEGWCWTPAYEARVGAHDLPHGDVDHGGRHRLAAGAVQGRRAEQLGEAEHRHHVDGGEAAAPAERSSGHHAGGVRGHHHGDRPQRVATLRPAHGGGQRIERRRSEGGGGDGHGHESMVRKGCHSGPAVESRSRRSAFGPARLGCPDGPG